MAKYLQTVICVNLLPKLISAIRLRPLRVVEYYAGPQTDQNWVSWKPYVQVTSETLSLDGYHQCIVICWKRTNMPTLRKKQANNLQGRFSAIPMV